MMEQNKDKMKKILFEELKEMADFCNFKNSKFHSKVNAILQRLSELQPVNKCYECGYPLTLQGNGIAERICTCNKLQPVNKTDEEPSENIGREELVGKIARAEYAKIVIDFPDEKWLEFEEMMSGAGGIFLHRVIASILPSSTSRENGVNVELLEALRSIHDNLPKWDKNGEEFDTEFIDRVIENLEKQLKK